MHDHCPIDQPRQSDVINEGDKYLSSKNDFLIKNKNKNQTKKKKTCVFE